MLGYIVAGIVALVVVIASSKDAESAESYSGPPLLDWEHFKAINKPGSLFVWNHIEYPDYRYAELSMGLEAQSLPLVSIDQNIFNDPITMKEAKAFFQSEDVYDLTPAEVLGLIKAFIPDGLRGIAAAIAWHESRFLPLAMGPSKDYGLYQITMETATWEGWNSQAALDVAEAPYLLFDPETSTKLASELLVRWASKYGENLWVAPIFRRWGGGNQLLHPEEDYQNMLMLTAAYNDILRG